MSGGRMHTQTFELLRHVAVHGGRTRAEVIKAFPGAAKVETALTNLAYLGYVAADHTTTPVQYTVTGKGRKKLMLTSAAMAPRRDPALMKADVFPATLKKRHRPKEGDYQATEYEPSTRPGAMVAAGLPSRFGDTLRFPGGRVTDLAGNPITSP
jgi:hypothetical protein